MQQAEESYDCCWLVLTFWIGKAALHPPSTSVSLSCACFAWSGTKLYLHGNRPVGCSQAREGTVEHHSPGYIALAQMCKSYCKN